MTDGVAGLAPGAILLAIAIMAVGSALQAAVGMGLALFAVPLLVLLDARFIPGPIQIAAIVLALGLAHRERSAIEWPGLRMALAGLLVGTVLGSLALAAVDTTQLPRVFGVLILAGVGLSLTGITVQPGSASMLAGGTVAGVMGAMVGIHGPPIALVLQHAEPHRLRAMLAAFFAVGYVAAVVVLTVAGLVGRQEVVLGLLLTPGAAIGLMLGPYRARWIDRGRLRIAVLSISAISAVGLLLR